MNARRTNRRRAGLAVVTALVIGACSNGGSDDDTSGPATTEGRTNPIVDDTTDTAGDATGTKLGFRLSEGSAAAAPADPTTVLDGTPLDQSALEALVARLPEWLGGTSATESFSWPAQSLTPPRAGETVQEAFPPDGDAGEAPDVATGPLHVVRVQPDGTVPLAPYVAITFDQPMV
ncbi:MAG: hypothetical protein R2715_25305, partial [Ilumatobacteraceae bacterium]